jgi:hypothetical protein
MCSRRSIIVREHAPWLADSITDFIESLLQRLEANEVVDDKVTRIIEESRVLWPRQMFVVMTLTWQVREDVIQ